MPGNQEEHEQLSRSDYALAGRGTIEPVELDEATAGRLLRTINRQHARSPLTIEDVYLFPGVPSTQAIDYYGTRMTPRSMRNYRADVKGGIALMNMHRTGGWSSEGEQPVGRIFEAELVGDAVEPGAGFDGQHGMALQTWQYMLRGIQVTDVANDDLIRAIEGGTTKDMSIGFSTYPDGEFECSICGRPYYGRDEDGDYCPHLAFSTYEDEEGEAVRCFVWVENAHVYEASLVYKGATPGAMVRKAKQYADRLPKDEVEWLEERYQVRLLDRGAVALPGKRNQGEEPPSVPPARGEGGSLPEAEEEVRMDRSTVVERLRALVGEERLAELEAIEDDGEFVAQSLRAMTEAHEAQVNELLAEAEALETRVSALEPDAEIGLAYKTDLVNEAVKARVQAEGNDCPAEKYRAVLMGQDDLEFIKAERKAWQARAAEVLKSGRQIPVGGEDAEVRAPAAAYGG